MSKDKALQAVLSMRQNKEKQRLLALMAAQAAHRNLVAQIEETSARLNQEVQAVSGAQLALAQAQTLSLASDLQDLDQQKADTELLISMGQQNYAQAHTETAAIDQLLTNRARIRAAFAQRQERIDEDEAGLAAWATKGAQQTA